MQYKERWDAVLLEELPKIREEYIYAEDLCLLLGKGDSVQWTPGTLSYLTKMMGQHGWKVIRKSDGKVYVKDADGDFSGESESSTLFSEWADLLSQELEKITDNQVPVEYLCSLISEDPQAWNSGTKALLTKVMTSLGWKSFRDKRKGKFHRIYQREVLREEVSSEKVTFSPPLEKVSEPQVEVVSEPQVEVVSEPQVEVVSEPQVEASTSSSPLGSEEEKGSPEVVEERLATHFISVEEIDSYILEKGYINRIPEDKWEEVIREWLGTLNSEVGFEGHIVERLLVNLGDSTWTSANKIEANKILRSLGWEVKRRNINKKVLRIWENRTGTIPPLEINKEPVEEPVIFPAEGTNGKGKVEIEEGKPEWYLNLMGGIGGLVWDTFQEVLEEVTQECLVTSSLEEAKGLCADLEEQQGTLLKRDKEISEREQEIRKAALTLLGDEKKLHEKSLFLKRKEEELEAFSAALNVFEQEFEEKKEKAWENIAEERERLATFEVKRDLLSNKKDELQKRVLELEELLKKETEQKNNFQKRLEEGEKTPGNRGFSYLVGTSHETEEELKKSKIEVDSLKGKVKELEKRLDEASKGVFTKTPPRSIKDMFDWFNVSLRPRTLARGNTSSTGERQIRIVLTEDEIHRDVVLDGGISTRRYLSLSLEEDPRRLIDIFYPHNIFSREELDWGVVDIMRLLGKPLSFPMSDNKYSRTTEY